MFKKILFLTLALPFLLFVPRADAAQKNLKLTTYYPAPYGEYATMKVGTPKSTSGMTNAGAFSLLGSSPQMDFIDSDGQDWAIQVDAGKMSFVREAWNDDLVLDGAGRVGIGTDAPNQDSKLEVVGAPIRATGGLILPVVNVTGGGTAPTADGSIWIQT
jgi:hypothetical protein